MNILAELFHNDTAHRSLSADPVNGYFKLRVSCKADGSLLA